MAVDRNGDVFADQGRSGQVTELPVLNGPVSPAASTVTAAPASIPADGFTSSTITVQAKAAHGIDETSGGATVVLSTTLGTLSAVTDNGNGTYTATLTSTQTGAADVSAKINRQSVTSGDAYVTVAEPSAPTVTGVTHAAGPTSGGTQITITGTGFAVNDTVEFGATAAESVTSRSSQKLTAKSPPGGAGPVNVTVTTSGGTSAASAASTFTYITPPSITSITPDTGPVAGGTLVQINGKNFLPGATAKVGAASVATTYDSPTELTATTPPGSAGTVPVSINVYAAGQRVRSNPAASDLFAYGPPTITAFTPTSGKKGTKVTITGTGFAPGVTVRFATTAASSVSVSSGTTLTAVVPAGVVAGPITVSDAQGSATSTGTFTPTS